MIVVELDSCDQVKNCSWSRLKEQFTQSSPKFSHLNLSAVQIVCM